MSAVADMPPLSGAFRTAGARNGNRRDTAWCAIQTTFRLPHNCPAAADWSLSGGAPATRWPFRGPSHSCFGAARRRPGVPRGSARSGRCACWCPRRPCRARIGLEPRGALRREKTVSTLEFCGPIPQGSGAVEVARRAARNLGPGPRGGGAASPGRDIRSRSASDLLVIELKATRFYDEAADQLDDYLDEVAEHLARSGEGIHGLLITDGADHGDVERLDERGLGHVSLAALGYRLALAQGAAPPPAPVTANSPARRSPGASTDEPLISPVTGDPAPLDGPETYWVRLFYDIGATADEASQRAAADELWERRERRRRRDEQDYGLPSAWPAAHPATVIAVRHGRWPVTAAVCIACDWLAREHEDGQLVDLHAAATSHALAHPHDSGLERASTRVGAAPGSGEHLHMPDVLDRARTGHRDHRTGTQPGGLHALGSDVGCAPLNAHRPRWGNLGESSAGPRVRAGQRLFSLRV